MAKSQVETSNSAPEWIQQLMGMMLVGNIASSNRAMSSASAPTTPAPQPPQQYYQEPLTPFTPVPSLKRPGSPLNYPTLDVWLRSLVNDPVRQRKAQGYQDFLSFFSMNGIEDLEDLLRLTSDELMKIIPDINIGTAKRILAFAHDDDPALRERKRPHLV
jgi:SAM domain (Sterile alpha motif)